MGPRSLSRRLIVMNVTAVAAVVIVAAAALWGLGRLQSEVRSISSEYEELRLVEHALSRVRIARAQAEGGRVLQAASLDEARAAVESFRRYQHSEEEADPEHQAEEQDVADAILARLAAVRDTGPEDAAPMLALLETELLRLEAATSVEGAVAEAKRSTTITVLVVLLVAGSIAVTSAMASLAGYRALMRPLDRLRAGARRIAAGRFDERVDASGPLELGQVAEDFNQMATELETLYRVMEEKVESKSRELVRSERLASVGYLAAGVAHEINNPLGIISGYAELSQRRLRGEAPSAGIAETQTALEAIRQEAFRCRRITEGLLSLARRGDDDRDAVSLTQIAQEAETLVRALDRFRSRRIEIAADVADDALVSGNEGELKQVVLNLLLNALEATDRVGGQVEITVRRRPPWVELAVTDNGHGLDESALGKIFEPFYSRRADGSRGTGLGLSISHAIVEGHGGRLEAASEGPGRGTCFTVRLPALVAAEAEA